MIQTPCWPDSEVGRILKPDAEEIADHIFRAVHCTTELQIANTFDGDRIPILPEVFVNQFLDPRREYVQSVVLGESGTGKSHLIQWLRLHIPYDESTVLLTIPKIGTSLRGIIERLVARLPEEERGSYEQRLQQAGTHATSHAAKVSKFLDSLAWAIEHSGLATDDDIDLSALIPDILRDPNFRREFFLIPNNTIDAIVQHVFVDPEHRDISDDRREFSLKDLPLDGQRYNDASKNAKEAIDYIKGEPGMDKRAIALMNLNLNAAIAQTLNFSADNLIELMNALRRHLAAQGKRLILLIEDFARLQGIDTALLQALITPPGQVDDRLCELRWAMAVTTGYFRRLEQTVRTRTTFLVDMDLSKPASLSQLTAGYMNALRIGEARLQGSSPLDPIQSWCSQCEKKETCFAAFGEVDGIGLFPFTDSAIGVMAERTESITAEGKFNPRRFLQKVLEGVLFHHYEDLESGEFPPDELLKRIGGSNALKPIDRQRLEQMDGTHFVRRNVLLELWNGTGYIVNLPEGIHDAFGIPLLSDVTDSRSNLDLESKTSDLKQKTSVPSQPNISVSIEIEAVRRWASDNAMLPQNVVTELRQLVFAALESFIDWDKLGYKKAMVASPSGIAAIPFRQVSINFKNQQTQRQSALITLDISTDSVLALEALLMQKHYGSWDFPDSGQLLANLLETLRSWSIQIEQQLKFLYGEQAEWSPIVAIVELLTIAIHQGRRITIGDNQIETVISRMWESSTPNALQGINRPFTELNKRLVNYWPKYIEMLRNLSSGTKGGVVGNFVRITPILRAVKSLRHRSLLLTQTPPNDSPSKELKELADLYRRIQSEFPTYLAEEKSAWAQWLLTVQEAISDDTKIAALIDALKTAVNDVSNQGLYAGASRKNLNEILDSINPTTIERALGHVRALSDSNNADFFIRLASIGDSKGEIENLIMHADTFLQNANAAVANKRHRLELQSNAGLRESELRIEQSLDQLSQSFNALYALGGSA